MSHTPPHQKADDALDNLLQSHLNAPAEQLAPSSGFVLSVMDAIQQQATEPAPVAFPWKRVLPGAIAILCALVAFIVYAYAGRHSTPAIRPNLVLSSTFTSSEITLCWIALAVCLSVITVAASFRLAGRSR
jgi:hypothetical protein